MPPRVLVLRAPGTNCDGEAVFAFEKAGARADRVHVARLLESPRLFDDYQILCLPGGFSYGDDLGAGRILASQLRHHLGERLRSFAAADRLVLGICNGFQVLVQTGLLWANDEQGSLATLAGNDSGRFIDRWTPLKTSGNRCVFLAGIDRMYLPIAHGEGKFVTRDESILRRLDEAGQLVLRYAPANGAVNGPADNPNGSQADVAGVCDATGRIFGLMPHPERHIDPTQHPRWTREGLRPAGDGLAMFQNAVKYFS